MMRNQSGQDISDVLGPSRCTLEAALGKESQERAVWKFFLILDKEEGDEDEREDWLKGELER